MENTLPKKPKFAFKKIVDCLTKYLSLILIVPAVFGGIWQIINLSRISLAYIRFFSVSQIIPDGLLILVLLFIWFVVFYGMYLYFKRIRKNKSDDKTDSHQNTIAVLVFFCIICSVILYFSKNIFFSDSVSFIEIFIFPLAVINFTFLFFSIITLIAFLRNFTREKFDKFFKLLAIPYFLILIVMLGVFLRNFNKSFIIPGNLQNIENVKCKLGDSEKSTKYEILYFNDTYVFIEKMKISSLDGKEYGAEVIIVKIEEFFNEDYCVEFNKKKQEEDQRKYNNSINNTPLGKKIKEDSIKIENTIKRIDSLNGLMKSKIESRELKK